MRSSIVLVVAFLFSTTSVLSQTWTQLPDVPGDPLDGAVTFVIDDKIYLCGGAYSKRMYMFDPGTNVWMDKGPIPGVLVDRWIGCGFALDGKGYIGLGYDGPNVMNDFWSYDPSTNGWTQLTDHPSNGRSGSIAFAVNGKGYVGGGADDTDYYQELHEYDPLTDSWALVMALPAGPTLFGNSFTIGDRAFVVGGDHGGFEDEQLYEFDPINYEWIERAPFIGGPRQAAVSFSVGDVGYHGGGHTEYTVGFDDLFAYDALNDVWIPAGDIPGGIRGWAAGAGVQGKGYLGTGFDLNSQYLSDWWSFDNAVGMEDLDPLPEFSVYPTIATDRIWIDPTGHAAQHLMISDAAGRIVIPMFLLSGRTELDISDLSAGTYHVVTRSGHRSKAIPFVKTR